MTVEVRGRAETLPLLGQAVPVDDHQWWSGIGRGTAETAGQRPKRSGPAETLPLVGQAVPVDDHQ